MAPDSEHVPSFSTYRRTPLSPSEIHTHAVMILKGPLTSSEQPPRNGPSPLGWKVSMREDLTASSDESPRRTDLRRTAGRDLLGTGPEVPGTRKLFPGRWKLDEASVGERREQLDLWFAPLGIYWSETLRGHRPLRVQCLANSGQRICLDVVDSWQMDGNQCYRLTIAPLQQA